MASSLPEEVLDELDLEPGSEVAFKRGPDGTFVLEKVGDAETPRLSREEIARRIRAVAGAAGPGPSTDEFMEMLRGGD